MAALNRKQVMLYIVVGLAIGLVVAGIAWAVFGRQAPTPDATSDSHESTATAETTASDEVTGSSEPTSVATDKTMPPVPDTSGEAPATNPETSPDTTPATVERQPGELKGVTGSGGSYVLTIDYVLFLTGGEAADAAAAHGDESPPPNDYYIVNDNPKLREFPIQPGITVKCVTNDDGSLVVEGRMMPLDAWVAAVNGPQANAFKSSIYWIALTNGTVTAIEQMFLP